MVAVTEPNEIHQLAPTTAHATMVPDYAVAPGEWLDEWIGDQNSSITEVAVKMELTQDQVERILDGRLSVTAGLSVRLERLTKIPAHIWLRYEDLYRSDRARLARAWVRA